MEKKYTIARGCAAILMLPLLFFFFLFVLLFSVPSENGERHPLQFILFVLIPSLALSALYFAYPYIVARRKRKKEAELKIQHEKYWEDFNNSQEESRMRNLRALRTPGADSRYSNNFSELKGASFVCIDFETANRYRSSACQIGIVEVENGEIIDEFCALIQPPGNEYELSNTNVHGISAKDTSLEMPFNQLWPRIEKYINGRILVAHYMEFDNSVLTATAEHYGITPSPQAYYCTYNATSLALIEAAQAYSLDVGGHHNALADARMCAKIAIALSNGEEMDERLIKVRKGGREYDNITLVKELCANPSGCFDGLGILVTGVFGQFTRGDIIEVLETHGATIKKSISKNVDCVVVGLDPGPSKMKKITELQNKGHLIRLITEDELIHIVRESL